MASTGAGSSSSQLTSDPHTDGSCPAARPVEPISGRLGRKWGGVRGLQRWGLVPQDCCKPDQPTGWEKMPGGPGILQGPPPGTVLLLLICAAGLGMLLTGGRLGEEGALRRLERGHGQRKGLQEGDREGSRRGPGTGLCRNCTRLLARWFQTGLGRLAGGGSALLKGHPPPRGGRPEPECLPYPVPWAQNEELGLPLTELQSWG